MLGQNHTVPDLEDVKADFNRLDGKDKRWMSIALAVAASAFVLAALGGSLLGNLISFVLTFAAGWFVHDQWYAIRGSRAKSKPSSTTRSTFQ